MKIIEEWCERSGLKVNPVKAEIVRFSKDHNKELSKKVRILGNEVKQARSIKYRW